MCSLVLYSLANILVGRKSGNEIGLAARRDAQAPNAAPLARQDRRDLRQVVALGASLLAHSSPAFLRRQEVAVASEVQ